MKLSTQTIATASARHPWRALGAWLAASFAAVAAIGVLLGGSLTTEGAPTNNSESEQAVDAEARAFPPDPATLVTDVVVVRSGRQRPGGVHVDDRGVPVRHRVGTEAGRTP